MTEPESATAFAPATVANVAVGFDVLGFAFDAVGDTVRVERSTSRGVELGSIDGPYAMEPDAATNTATVALRALAERSGLSFGLRVHVRKEIPVSSGMGGSAASAVAAVVAANALLGEPLSSDQLLEFALDGEAAASGVRHADNVAPSLRGGLTATLGVDSVEILSLPVPSLQAVLVHPHLFVETRAARTVLPASVPLAEYVRQSSCLAAFVDACHRDDHALLARAMRDLLIEPHRAGAIPGYFDVKAASIDAGAVGCGISGSGPSVFAWAKPADADSVLLAMRRAFEQHSVDTDAWVTSIGGGAHVVEVS